jgi:hypothetical protein
VLTQFSSCINDLTTWVCFPAGNLSVGHCVQTGSGVHPASYPLSLSSGVKQPRLEADHLPPSNAEVKNACYLHLHGVMVN